MRTPLHNPPIRAPVEEVDGLCDAPAVGAAVISEGDVAAEMTTVCVVVSVTDSTLGGEKGKVTIGVLVVPVADPPSAGKEIVGVLPVISELPVNVSSNTMVADSATTDVLICVVESSMPAPVLTVVPGDGVRG